MYIPLSEYIDSLWPKNILEPPPLDQINDVWIEPLRIETEPNLDVKTSILLEQELSLAIPGIDGVSIVLAAAGNDSAFLFEFFTIPAPGMVIVDIPIAIRFARDLLTPAKLVTDTNGNQVVQPEETLDHVDITLAKITLTAGFDGGFGIEADGGIDLPLCLIGDTGVGIEARNIRFVGANDTPPPGKPTGWNGIHIPNAGLWLPGELGSIVGHLTLTDATIGNGGFSGTVTDTWAPELATSIGGMDLKLKSVAISLIQNSFTQCEIHGTINLPFFDAPVDVELGINLDGSFAVKLASANGLLTLNKPGVLELELQSLGFAWSGETLTAKLGGKIRPLVGGLDWPGFELRELSIDSHGNVKLEGGWIDLRDGYALDFHGFKVEISRIGFGRSDDGGKWIGFSGGLNLVDGFAAGASVEGLKVIWYEDLSHLPKITLEGVGVEFVVPNAVSFKGHVSYREFIDSSGGLVHQFDGDIKLNLLSLGMEVDAVLVIGSSLKPDGHSYTFFAIYIAVELPAGIPLWTTGLGLYGLAGLFAIQMEPDKRTDEEWYGVGSNDGWYKRPQIGVTDLGGKWRNEEGSLALGGGLTIGTVADNGFTFSGRMLLVLVFPGPILMIEGKANLLKERSKLSDEPLFRALAVLDGRSGTLLFGLDAQYKMGAGGELINIRGGVEAFFDFHDLDRWHIYLGINEPREKRIRAHIFNLFEANAYFMLDAHSLRTGAWVGYDKHWKYGPVKITLEAWLETNVMVNWKPTHFHGDLWAHGKVEMRVFGFGFSLSLDARLAGDVFDPFHILAELSVELNLPWPLPNVDVDFTLEWGPEPTPPPIPMVLKEVAVEHMKVSTSWPLPRTSLLLPNYDREGFIGAPIGPSILPDLSFSPVVPLDCRPHITFGRPVHDAALIGINPQPPNPVYERIGDPASNQGPARVKYILRAVTLEKFSGGVWFMIARKADSPNPSGVPELFGSWAPVPAAFGGSETQSVAQVKLWIWSKNPFDYTRNTSGSWDEWFTDNYPSYPCIPDAPSKYICCDFTQYRLGYPIDIPHHCDPEMLIFGFPPKLIHVERVNPSIDGIDRMACFMPESFMQVRFVRPARKVDIHLSSKPLDKITCIDFSDHAVGRDQNSLVWRSVSFTIFGSNGTKSAATQFRDVNGVRSLDTGFRAHIELPQASDQVTLTLIRQASEIKVEAFNKQGQVVAFGGVPVSATGPQTIVLNGSSITMIHIVAPNNEASIQKVCYGSTGELDVRAIVDFSDGTQSPPMFSENDHIIVNKEGIVAVTVRGRSKFCVIQICADLGPDPEDVENRQEMATHLQNATVHWSQVGAVLEPNTFYRMKILTRAEALGEGELAGWSDIRDQEEIAYFRTEGSPGLTNLSVPVNHPDPNKFDSGLDDLSRYVKQTVPATVPLPGQKPLLPKPVYRAYDVGVEFNEDYVDMMYRISGRDLGLYLFDNNNLPVRDAAGRLIVRQNEWGKVEISTFDATEQRWIQIVNTSTCALIGESTVPKHVKLTSSAAGQVLQPDTVYEARLMPVLVHENFADLPAGTIASGTGSTLARWRIVDQGTLQGPSEWQIAETLAPVTRYVVQTTNIWGGTTDGVDPIKPGSMMIYGNDPNLSATHADQPAQWTDYRVSAYVRNEDDDALGLVFRYVNPNNYYRFSMDAERRYRRLVRVVDSIHTILAEDDRRYQSNTDYSITVEAIGSSLKVYLDGELILSAEDPSHAAGGIGLYCWASEKARFFDIKVDDFRNTDPVTKRPAPVYRFPFTTSKFAHFTHHMQSYDDKIWLSSLDPGVDTLTWIAAANPPDSPVTEVESRAFDELSHAVMGPAAEGFPNSLEVIRVEQNGHTFGFLVQTSEPFDWSRIDLQLLRADPLTQMPIVTPESLKMVSASFATNLPREESVNLVTRDSINLRGYAIEAFRVSGPIKGSVENEYLFEDFNESGQGILFKETFGPNALDRYVILDQGTLLPPSAWTVDAAIRQSSNIAGGILAGNDNAKPGTMAITGNPEWGSIRIRTRLMSTDNDGIGIVFRYQDGSNYYRFSTDSERNYRRLVKCENSVFITLWEDMTNSYSPNVAFDLQIDAYGNRLVGLLDNVVQFDVIDDAFKMGQIGLYSWLNTGAQFQSLIVESLDADPVLAKPDLTKLDGWLVLDPEGALDGPSAWTPDPMGMRQTAFIHVDGMDHIGAHLVNSQHWDDLQFFVDLRSSEEEGAIGILLRYQDKQNYYRFSMNRAENYHRLEKCVNSTVTVLWQSAVGFDLDRTYCLSLQAKGVEIRGFLDGEVMFTVTDGDLAKGSIGFYTWNNGGATFSRAWVLSLAKYIGSFRILDGQGLSGESFWRTQFGELQQRSSLGNAAAPHLGTHAIASTEITSDMRLVVEARSDSDMPFGVLFRYRDEANYYRFAVSSADHVRRLIKMVDGTTTTLWEAAGGYSPGNTHRFTVDAFGDRLIGYFDGEKLFGIRDTSIASGRVGVYTSQNDSVAFDVIRVSTPPIDAYALFTDNFAQNDVTDWTFVSQSTTGGIPHWVALDGVLTQTSGAYAPPARVAKIEKKGLYAVAGDLAWGDVVFRARLQSHGNRAIGVMFRYRDQNHYYRFSMDRTHKYRRLVKNVGGVFTKLWEDDFVFEVGHSYEVVIIAAGSQIWGYFDGVPMFAVEDSDLTDGLVGLYCWRNPNSKFSCVTVLPIEAAFSDWAFKDNFPYLVVDKWTFTDVGRTDAPSKWAVTDKQLMQTGSISGDKPWKGTFAVSDIGSRDWPDYRLTASIVSSTTGVVGLVARYQDPNNHYRFEIGSGILGRRLLKMVNGFEEELWSDLKGYEKDVPVLATIECIGQRIACYVNGVEVCEVADDALTKGRIALFTFKNSGAKFDFVRVQEAAWQNHYSFGKQTTVPAGHRIRVLSCSESFAPAPVPNTNDVFIAGPGEQGNFHFYGSACDLRVRDSLGKVKHARTFLRSSRYAPMPTIKLLRRQDGCGFFLALPSAVSEGSRFEHAQYRLKLAYRLDNTTSDVNSQIQREAGLSDSEITQIDLPLMRLP
jgi:hypothetical protein